MKIDHARRLIKREKLLTYGFIGIFALLILGALFFARHAIYNVWVGPFNATTDELLALDDVADHYLWSAPERWVTITVDTAYSVPTTHSHQNDDGDINVTYAMVVKFDDYLMIVELDEPPTADMPTTLTGFVDKFYPVACCRFHSRIIEDFQQQYPDVDGVFLGIVLDQPESLVSTFRVLTFILIGLFILTGLGLLWAIWFMRNPRRHGFMRKLKKYGDPVKVLAEIEHELAQDRTHCLKQYCFTENWFVYATFSNFQAVQYEDIMRFHQVQGTRFWCIYDRYNKQILVSRPHDEIIKTLTFEAPWAVTKDTREINQQWRQHRQDFIDKVDRTRSEHEKPKKRKQLPTDSIIEWD